MYRLIRNLLFLLPPEDAHYYTMRALQKTASVDFLKSFLQKQFHIESNPAPFLNIPFKNRVGLAAGFDKNAMYLDELSLLGFGHVEIGTVTPKPQPGNETPRLFRLQKDNALINRMGFNNNGIKAVRGRLEMWQNKKSILKNDMVVGGNIGKNKATANENAHEDYLTCFNEIYALVDYFVVNVSSPNTPGLRALQERPALEKIFDALKNAAVNKPIQKPLLLKIAPDLTTEQIDEVIGLVLDMNIDGLVISNTTIDRSNLKSNVNIINQPGGLSGAPLFKKSTDVLKYVSRQTQNKVPIIASGGIMNKENALEKIIAGAGLVQLYTGFIYEGPQLIKSISNHLSRHQ